MTSWNKGKKLSKKHRLALSRARLGKIPWNKGKTGVYSENTLKQMSAWQIGKKHALKTKKSISKSHFGMKKPWRSKDWLGKRNPRWSGGLSTDYYTSDFKTKIRYEIINRDECCIICHNIIDLVVHHIDEHKLNNDYSNLTTLCRSCHTGIHISKNTKLKSILIKTLKLRRNIK